MLTAVTLVLLLVTAGSNVWSAYESRQSNRIALGEGKPMADQTHKPSRRPQIVMLVLTVLTWSAVGFDYYDRHRGTVLTWDETTPLDPIYGSVRRFINETVPLDGRHYINPTFEDVTFEYEGTRPSQMDNPQFVIHAGQVSGGIKSYNPIVNQTIEIMHTLEGAAGCNNTGVVVFPPGTK
jgi:hypothetical protein